MSVSLEDSEVVFAVLDGLAKELAQIGYYWTSYKCLYCDEENVLVLNEASSGFFGMHQSCLPIYVDLCIARLFDPSVSGKGSARKTNLTLYSAVELLKPYVDECFQNSIELRVNAVKDSIPRILINRNKRIAHLDRFAYLDQNRLPGHIISEYDRATAEMEQILIDIYASVQNTELSLSSMKSDASADVAELIRSLSQVTTSC